MVWLGVAGVERRPLVFVEDHLYHTSDLLAALQATRPDLLGWTTVVALDRRGPDTDAIVSEWLEQYPGLQVAARAPARDRVREIEPRDLIDAASYGRLVGHLLRPGGVLIQDIQLETLAFLPPDRWWESIYLAATVRGMFPDRVPLVRLLSNKRGYSATFGRDLLDAGFDPRDVMDKSDLTATVVPAIAALCDRLFSRRLDAVLPPAPRRVWPVADSDGERRDVADALDLVLFPTSGGAELSGRLVNGDQGIVALRAGSQEIDSWAALIADRLSDGGGVPVLALGARIGPAGAERAELTNLAARHMHTMRGRLVDERVIATVRHAYRLDATLRVGITTPLSRHPNGR